MCNSDGAAELLLWRVEGLVNLMGWWVVGEVQSFEENLVHRKQKNHSSRLGISINIDEKTLNKSQKDIGFVTSRAGRPSQEQSD